jgi:hypothetical protein
LKKNNFYTLPDDILKMAKDSELILDEDLLFDNTASIYTSQHFARRVEFTEEIKNKAKENFDFLCSIDKNDKLFHINKYGKNQNFLHVHHIIPASMQKTFKNLDLGSIDNALPICPYCHELLHHAVPEEKIKVIDSIFKLKEKYMNELSIDRYELLDIYQNL